MVTSLPSLSISLSVSLSLSLSLSPKVPHAQYRKRFSASYNSAPVPQLHRQSSWCEIRNFPGRSLMQIFFGWRHGVASKKSLSFTLFYPFWPGRHWLCPPDERKEVQACFLGIAKAFGRVDHEVARVSHLVYLRAPFWNHRVTLVSPLSQGSLNCCQWFFRSFCWRHACLWLLYCLQHITLLSLAARFG